MSSRSLKHLEPITRAHAYALLDACKAYGFELLIYTTYRSPEEQAKLYRRGRSLDVIKKKAVELAYQYEREDLADVLMGVGPQYGSKVTNAAPGQSMHNYGVAFDAVPLVGGKASWGERTEEEQRLWSEYGRLAKNLGLEWSGDWTRFKEKPHSQLPNLDWKEMIAECPINLESWLAHPRYNRTLSMMDETVKPGWAMQGNQDLGVPQEAVVIVRDGEDAVVMPAIASDDEPARSVSLSSDTELTDEEPLGESRGRAATPQEIAAMREKKPSPAEEALKTYGVGTVRLQ